MKNKICIAVIALAIGAVSCQKNDTSENSNKSDKGITNNLMAAVTDVASVQAGSECIGDIQSVSLMKFKHGRGMVGGMMSFPGMNMKFVDPRVSECATITVSDSTYPQTITIDYGTGCSGEHRHVKSGKIIIEISDTLVIAGSLKTIRTENFKIDSMQVDLVASIENLGKNSEGNWIIASNYKQSMTNASGNKISEIYSDTTTWKSGFETIDKSDDVFYKTGSGVKTVNDTIKFSHVITKPLLFDKSCEFIKSGVINITRNTDNIVIDYGDGTCDSSASITTNGTTESIDLSTQRFKEGGRFGKQCGGRFGKGPKG